MIGRGGGGAVGGGERRLFFLSFGDAAAAEHDVVDCLRAAARAWQQDAVFDKPDHLQ